MALMYDTIMDLPLFKGIGVEQLSLMLEKTCINFENFNAGQEIIKRGEQVKTVDFIIKGKVLQTHKFLKLNIIIEEILPDGSVLGADNLYGLTTHYPADIKAFDNVSIMRIGKEQYMDILMSHRIYLMNYLNFLSASAQRRENLIINASSFSITNSLVKMAKSVVSPTAEQVRIKASDKELADYLGVNSADIVKWKKSINNHDYIKVDSDLITITMKSK